MPKPKVDRSKIKKPKKAILWDLKTVHADIDRKSWAVLDELGVDENASMAALIVEGLNLVLAARGIEVRVERRTPEMGEAGSASVPSPQPQGKLL
ncbi:hypothetical protein ACQKQD_18545 [Methylobacterium sp. NPDC080182]|uniref:hypothetical protein n=1 Tax=Methylobacterium sp. NPDC080182 TaxID=3390590 RepID=UPI003CFF8753